MTILNRVSSRVILSSGGAATTVPEVVAPPGQALFGTNVGPGTFSWTVPANVKTISAVAVGGGGGGPYIWDTGGGAGGGALGPGAFRPAADRDRPGGFAAHGQQRAAVRTRVDYRAHPASHRREHCANRYGALDVLIGGQRAVAHCR